MVHISKGRYTRIHLLPVLSPSSQSTVTANQSENGSPSTTMLIHCNRQNGRLGEQRAEAVQTQACPERY